MQLIKLPVGPVAPVPSSDSLRMILPRPIEGEDVFQISPSVFDYSIVQVLTVQLRIQSFGPGGASLQ